MVEMAQLRVQATEPPLPSSSSQAEQAPPWTEFRYLISSVISVSLASTAPGPLRTHACLSKRGKRPAGMVELRFENGHP